MTPLEQAIIAANPSILDLEFGCRAEIEGCLPERIAGVFQRPYGKVIRTEITGEEWPVEKLKILGREIRLADVLLAIHKTRFPEAETAIIDEVAKHIVNEIHTEMWYIIERWDLSHDSLDAQSQPTKDFLTKLLTK